MTDTPYRFLRGRGVFVTRLDILKSLAVLLMIVDHTGFYFLGDDPIWRAIGRICVPIWFFLAGYHTPVLFPQRALMIGGTILGLVFAVVSGSIFPLNTLFTIILIQAQSLALLAVLNAPSAGSHMVKLVLLCLYVLLLTLVVPQTSAVVQYGSVAFLLGLAGLLKRHPCGLSRHEVLGFHIIVAIFTICCEIFVFRFSGVPALLCAFGMAGSMALLWVYRPHIYEGRRSLLLRLGGRYTLEIYVIHLIIFLMLWQLR